MSLDLDMGLALVNKAREKERDEHIFQQWVAQLPFMEKDNFISFDDYRDRVTGANIDPRPTADILAELDEVEKQFKEGGAENGN